jgi:hypothetical protein
MSASGSLGALVQSFFLDHLISVKGLRPTSVRSYRDTVRLFLGFVAADKGCRITALGLADLSFERVLGFLRHLEVDRGNHIATRNQRLAALHCLFEYVASRNPELLEVCQRVAAIPRKRVSPPETHFLEKDEVDTLLRGLPHDGRHAVRDRALVLFLYNTGARVSEAAELRFGHLDLDPTPVCASTARATSGATARCGSRPPGCSATWWRQRRDPRPTPTGRSSPPTAGHSPAPASTRSCVVTLHGWTIPEPTGGSARTPSATPQLFTFWSREWRST